VYLYTHAWCTPTVDGQLTLIFSDFQLTKRTTDRRCYFLVAVEQQRPLLTKNRFCQKSVSFSPAFATSCVHCIRPRPFLLFLLPFEKHENDTQLLHGFERCALIFDRFAQFGVVPKNNSVPLLLLFAHFVGCQPVVVDVFFFYRINRNTIPLNLGPLLLRGTVFYFTVSDLVKEVNRNNNPGKQPTTTDRNCYGVLCMCG
jgi:hypothetical protein